MRMNELQNELGATMQLNESDAPTPLRWESP